MKGSFHRNGAILNGGDGEGQNSYIADPYTVYVNPYYIITHSRRDLAQASRRRSGAIARPSPAAKRDEANWNEADNDLSDIESSLQPIGAKTNLLSLLNIVGAQENVDYNEIALYGEEPQTYAQAVMSFEDYDLIIGEELEEDPGNTPEPAGNQDRCTFSRYWPFVNHELDCDPVIYFYHSDYLGHTEFITDRNGEAYQYFHYSAFGEALIEEHSGQGTHTDYFRFNGKELDPETGNYYYGARSRRDYEDKATGRSAKLARPSPADKRGYYDPRVSVWLSVDPLSHKSPSQTPYHFVSNNPIMRIDPNGLTDFENKATGKTVSVEDGMDQTVTISKKNWQDAVDFSKNQDGNNPTKNYNDFISNNGGTAVPTENNGGFIKDEDMFVGFMGFKANNERKEVAAWEVNDGNGSSGFVVQPWKNNTSKKSENDPSSVRKFGFDNKSDIQRQWHTHPTLSSSAIFKELSKKDMEVSWDYFGLPVRAVYNKNEIYEGAWKRGEVLAKPWNGRSYGKKIKK